MTGPESPEANAKSSGSPHADLNMRIIQSLVWFVEDKYGPAKLDALSFEAGISSDELRSCKGWISLEQTEAFFRMVRSMTGSDQDFMKACTYRMRDSYGTLRFLLWATTPAQMLEMGQKHFSPISNFSTGDFERISDSKYRLRYFSNREESRLMCLSRQAQSEALPLLWDLPPASLRETACICKGDDHCEYELSVYEKSRLTPVLLGGVAGTIAAAVVAVFHLWPILGVSYLWGAAPFLGAALGYIFELRRANRHNLKVADDINRGLTRVVIENQETQHEILLLHQRQKDWSRRLEEQVELRTRASEEFSRKLHNILAEQTSAMKGVSHDMKNPLTVVLQTAEIMSDDLSPENRWMVEEQKNAVTRIRGLLDDMLALESSDISSLQFRPESVNTKPLEESLRRRLRALAGTKGLRISVISTKEMPPCIYVDRMVLDRVVDNLLTNAVKYTDNGSIVLELDGKPGFLTIKLSDTGRGVEKEDLLKIFRAGGSDPATRDANSHGLGLSVVVRLLARIGGKLEVMSLPGKGSTFWVHLPVESQGKTEEDLSEEGFSAGATDGVVTIRRTV